MLIRCHTSDSPQIGTAMTSTEQDLQWLERWKSKLAACAGPASVFAFQQNLIKSQALPISATAKMRTQQIFQLVSHCIANVPLYRDYAKFGTPNELTGDAKLWAGLPILKRSALQSQSQNLQAKRLPKGHEPVALLRSSGSTGSPVELMATNITATWQKAFALRAQIWFRRDFDQSLAVIRKFSRPTTLLPEGETSTHWADYEGIPFHTGKRFALEATKGRISDHLDWLHRRRPAYLMTLPSVLRELVVLSAQNANDWTPKGISTLAETVDDDLREAVKECWNIEINDTYSAEECGVIAIQCPSHGNYHIQTDSVLVEIVDDAGKPCIPGQEGTVVITTLSNFATPLIRYAIGDRAITGETCGCGRNQPILTRILGRERNLLVARDGKYWPSFGMRSFRDEVPVLSQQFRQTALDRLEMSYVSSAPLTVDQEDLLRAHLQKALPANMTIKLIRVDELPRHESGKAEMFISEIEN